MKKLNELKSKKAKLMDELRKINVDEITPEISQRVDSIETELQTLNEDIKVLLTIEKANMAEVEDTEEVEAGDEGRSDLLSNLQNFFRTGQVSKEYRGALGGFLLPFESIRTDLTLTQLGADNKNKTVADELSIAKSPAESLLEKIGITKYTGLNGDFVIPNMPQVSAGFVAETVAVPDASADPSNLKLSARRLGAFNVITKEVLYNSNPAIWNGIIQDIKDAWYRAQVADLFDQIQADAVDASTTIAGSTLAYQDVVGLQANVAYDLTKPVYVATPAVASFLKRTATISSVSGPVWEGPIFDGTVDGIPALSTSLANADHLLYFDGAAAVIGEWGPGLELLVNPYEYDEEGKVKITISGLTDTGFKNYRFASWIADVSI